MKIELLANHQQYIDIVTKWLNDEFGNEQSFNFYKGIIEHSLAENQLPITFVAIEDNELIGTVGIWRSDLLSRQELFPWLSALFVPEKYRNKGIGKELQEYVLEYCRKLQYKEIYLYTDIEDYYEKIGWQQIDKAYEYTGSEVKIYSYKLQSK